MLKESGRRNPTRVMENSRATSMARLDGAPIAATIGMPPMTAFCRSSKLARPDRSSRLLRSGAVS